jgi:hypothetical protein
VALSDGSVGVVGGRGMGIKNSARPLVLVIQGPDGSYQAGRPVRTDETEAGGGYRIGVAASMDPQQARVNVYRYLA